MQNRPQRREDFVNGGRESIEKVSAFAKCLDAAPAGFRRQDYYDRTIRVARDRASQMKQRSGFGADVAICAISVDGHLMRARIADFA